MTTNHFIGLVNERIIFDQNPHIIIYDDIYVYGHRKQAPINQARIEKLSTFRLHLQRMELEEAA